MRILEITQPKRRLYHGSRRSFPDGFILLPQSDGYANWPEAQHAEQIIEKYRPANSLSRYQSVFMVASRNAQRVERMGGYSDYMYEVMPIGRVERNDLSWYSAIEVYFWEEDDPEPRQYAEAYWKGIPNPDPNKRRWEYRAASAQIVRQV